MPLLLLLHLLSWRYWARHRGAFALATLGVALGVAVFVAVQCANYSVLRAFSSSLEAVSGRATVQIQGGARGLPESVYEQLVQNPDPRVRAAAPTLQKTLFSPTLKAGPRSEGTTLLVLGIDPFSQADFFDLDLETAPASTSPSTSSPAGAADTSASTSARAGSSTSGGPRSLRQAGEFLLRPDAIAISPSLARRFSLARGDKMELFVGSERKSFRVVAVASGEGLRGAFGGDFAVVDLANGPGSVR
jgi:putative ABC transport system permease protein